MCVDGGSMWQYVQWEVNSLHSLVEQEADTSSMDVHFVYGPSTFKKITAN